MDRRVRDSPSNTCTMGSVRIHQISYLFNLIYANLEMESRGLGWMNPDDVGRLEQVPDPAPR